MAIFNQTSPVHLAIGIFDGVHLGHREILGQASRASKEDGGLVAVLTFWPHPSHVLRSDHTVPMLYSRDLRTRFLADAGADEVMYQEFTKDFASMEAEKFPEFLKNAFPSLKTVSVGSGFWFGQDRRGDAALLVELGRGLGLDVRPVSRVDQGGEPLSSTRIREAVASGDIIAANSMLGRPYRAVGQIMSGDSIGREIGFPTFNLDWCPELQPRFGVYAVKALFPSFGSHSYAAVGNYGCRPTVTDGQADPVLEVHLLETPPENPGDCIEVAFHHHIRPEQKFESIEDLAKRIEMDVGIAKKLLAEI